MSDSPFITEDSINHARWVMRDAPMDVVERTMRTHDVPELVARMVVGRGITDAEIPLFLNPTLKDNFPDPFAMAGMEAAAAYLADAIMRERKIAIFGDFDVDGATSSSVLYRFLRGCGVLDVLVYIPDRLTEGYGPNAGAFAALKAQGAEIVILLDCGITAVETVAAGVDMGLEIVIIDHHEPADTLPGAAHIINPKRADDVSGLGMLAAVGVTFLTCVAVNKVLRETGFYAQGGKLEPPLKDMLDIVALGTVCDMVPLIGANRLFVKYGFPTMERSGNAGLRALMEVSGLSGEVTPYHAGFVLGPRINAGSRVHKSDLGAKLLCTDDAEEAKNIAWLLNDCNDMRKSLQAQMQIEAEQMVTDKGLDSNAVIVADGREKDWHTGLSGLVAGNLKEKYSKPVCVVAYVKLADGGGFEGRGSGRSVAGFHMAKALQAAEAAGVILKGGGHAMAGGFTILPEKVSDFSAFMNEQAALQMQDGAAGKEDIIVDGVLSVRGAKPDVVEMIRRQVGPFGMEFEEPLFLLQSVRIWSADIVGSDHIRLSVSDWEGGNRMKAMAFRAVGTPLGDAFLNHKIRSFHLLGSLKVDNWGGTQRVEMRVQDAVFCQ